MQNVHEIDLLVASRANGVEIGTIIHAHLSHEGRVQLIDTLLTRINDKQHPIAPRLFQNFDYGVLEGILNETRKDKG